MEFEIVVHDAGVEVIDSYKVLWDKNTINTIYASNPFTRKRFSLYIEWFIHTLCYKLHIQRSRTKDVFFDWGNKWFINMFK